MSSIYGWIFVLLFCIFFSFLDDTPPKINIAPENDGLEANLPGSRINTYIKTLSLDGKRLDHSTSTSIDVLESDVTALMFIPFGSW